MSSLDSTLDTQVADKFRKTRKSIFVVASCGGHLVQALDLYEAYEGLEVIYVINDRTDLDHKMLGRTIIITHAERGPKQLINFMEAIILVCRYKPGVVLSTGASPAVPFSIVSKFISRSCIIFVESMSRVTSPSVTARLMYYIADHFYIQWEALKDFFPKARFVGRLL